MRIEDEIDQQRFGNEYFKAHINLLYTAGWAQLQLATQLKPFNISIQQFNILRILRGRVPRPASIRELTERMLDKSSNASRLVDKLQAKGLVVKSTSPDDNRKLEVNITEKGLTLLEAASQKVEGKILSIYSVIPEEDAKSLNTIFDKLRE